MNPATFKKRHVSAYSRKKMAQAQQKRWAAYRQAKEQKVRESWEQHGREQATNGNGNSDNYTMLLKNTRERLSEYKIGYKDGWADALNFVKSQGKEV